MSPLPGMPGSQVSNEGDIMRLIADLQRQVRELAAQNVLATAGITTQTNGITVAGSETVNGSLSVTGTANFTGNTTIGGNANVTGNITKSNTWGAASLGDSAVIGTGGNGSPALTFTRSGTTFGQSVGLGFTQYSAGSVLTLNGPHASDPAYLQLATDQTFTLSAGSSGGPQLLSSAGLNGRSALYGGQTNGAVELYAYGTGKVQVYGNFAVTGTKAFLMDHPVNPDTMELMHAATESPVNGVEYWGTVTLDATGQATATLPGYFEALTKPTGRNIQLTPIGQTAVQVSADRIVDGTFVIYGAPGQEVDWLVKAERQNIVDGYDELSFPAEQYKPLIGPQLPRAGR